MPLNPPDITELKAIVDWVHLSDDVRELSLKYGDVELYISRNHAPAAPVVAAPAAPPAPVATAPAVATPADSVTTAVDSVTTAVAAPAPAAPAAPTGADVVAEDGVVVSAPMLGTFYSAPKPGAADFVEVGTRVEVGSVLCIVEVMKLMNNVEAPTAGVVTRILAQNNETVEYGQPLVVIRADA